MKLKFQKIFKKCWNFKNLKQNFENLLGNYPDLPYIIIHFDDQTNKWGVKIGFWGFGVNQ